MRISIWQQFASNHSNNFTVVGTFQTVEAAEQAVSELRYVLKTIAEWYERPENAEADNQYWAWRQRQNSNQQTSDPVPFTPPELAFSAEYKVAWDEPLEWVRNSKEVTGAVHLLDNHEFVHNTLETLCGAGPFDRLLEKLGARPVLSRVELIGNDISLDLVCTAADEATARWLCDTVDSLAVTADVRQWQFGTGEYGDPHQWVILSEAACDRLRVTLKGVHFTWIYEDLPRFVEYLRAHGFSDIAYTLYEEN